MESGVKYDLIVVGLGCAGLSTAYYYSEQVKGAKILGLEREAKSGDIGTSSYGDTRHFAYKPGTHVSNDMLKDSLQMWKQVEEKTGEKIIYPAKMLSLGDRDNEGFKSAIKNLSEDQILTPEQITQRFPAFENIPENYIGYVTEDAGIVKSRLALDAFQTLCEQNNIELVYNAKVVEVTKNEVKTEDGTTYNADNVVVATGPFTGEDFSVDDPNFVSVEQECYEFDDKSGMPYVFIESGELGSYNGWLTDDGLSHFKFSLHEEKNFEKVAKWVQHRLPSKVEEILNNSRRYQWRWSYFKDKPFVYETKEDGVHYAYGFKGYGFTQMPIHGQIVFETLINKKPFRYVK